MSESSCREIGSQEQELQAACTQLRQEVEQNTLSKRELESTIADLKQQSDSLPAKIAERELYLDKIDRHISRLEAEQNRLSIAVDSLSRSLSDRQAQELGLAQAKTEEISQHSVNKEKIEAEIAALESQFKILQSEIATQQVERNELQQQLYTLEEQQEQKSIENNKLDRSIKSRQSAIDELELEIKHRHQDKEDINYKIIELEDSIFFASGHNVDDSLNINIVDLYRQWQSTNKQISDLKEQISKLKQEKELLQYKKWQEHLIFKSNPHLQILEHIDRHEVITESEVNHRLDNSRASRQFANRLREYSLHLPFSVKVESSASGSRYVKEIVTIVEPPHPADVLQADLVEIELPHIQTNGAVSELENTIIQDSVFDVKSQSNDDSFERVTSAHNTCRSCERIPMYGHDYCSSCA
ncbi:hypothetical protein [Chamaesiphon polymorphus]|uniref:Uncharacterized protein n=1 Tax=Chamaesiphon polymorphus CCALA 037 TaxID=2107692 RepID=A0A2T1GBN5_9CYAN|nr:hypothetical protein [Chamaesiphon polymorphus]PSB54731.1 hypothetical protein C7B77_17250 [Chamaesiphon polymorphus CCALA 037]